MKYSFEEKKKAVSVVSVLIFLCVAGVIWLMSGHVRKDGPGTADGSVKHIGLIQSGVSLQDGSDEASPEEDAVAGTVDTASAVGQFVMVHVCGAVAMPGVYELDASARIGDAVCAAGGFKRNAAEDYLNLAENISDGQKIVVYTKKQVRAFDGNEQDGSKDCSDNGKYTDSAGSGLININTASKEELMTLQGIGESKASDIIAYRESNGRFNNTDELMNIPGIKEGVFSKISGSITV